MCTVSWIRDRDSVHLFCSRDELLTRSPASFPSRRRSLGLRYLAPVDGQRGGTWVAVNEFGLALCLLNAGPPGSAESSRGAIIPQLIGQPAGEVQRSLCSLDLSSYPPFRLVCLQLRTEGWSALYDGGRIEISPLEQTPALFSSSSTLPELVGPARARIFPEHACVESMLAFHRSHSPSRGALSPCMHREDAATVSFTHVRIGLGRASMIYWPGAPCQGLSARVYELPCRN